MKIYVLIAIIFSALTTFSCKEKENSKILDTPSITSVNEVVGHDKVQGIVLKVVAVGDADSSAIPRNDIYYIYNLSKREPDIGVERNSNSRFAEDDLVTIKVNKENSSISFIDRRGMENQELLYQYLKRTDSSYSNMKSRVPF
jgi:hypothetical protein